MIAATVAQFRRMRDNPRYCGMYALFYLGQCMLPTNHMLQTTNCTPPPSLTRAPVCRRIQRRRPWTARGWELQQRQ